MLRCSGPLPNRIPVLFATLLIFWFAGANRGAAAQEDPSKAVAGEEQLPHAEEALAAALAEAEKDGRLVFLHTGADW
ncbi:MAG: hypothetical protein PVJ76_09470 [Gemmatimonadota bacterium]|jgi:hypothetical protein